MVAWDAYGPRGEGMNVGIVGGGLAGLAVAAGLHASGHSVTVYEAGRATGGRMATTEVDGHPVDVGFHVLHTAYPAVHRWLDLDALGLQAMDPSTEVILPSTGKRRLLGDALRRPSTLLPTLRSVGVRDGVRLFRWRQVAARADLEAPLDAPSPTIDDGLESRGFGPRLRTQVLAPLFAGITLDAERNERMAFSTFTWGAMAKGQMTMPRDGIGAVPRQLAAHLPEGALRTGSTVTAITATTVEVDGDVVQHDRVVLATPQHVTASMLGLATPARERTTTTHVFSCATPPLSAARLLLNGEFNVAASPVLHVHVPTLLHPRADGQHLVVATLLDDRTDAAATLTHLDRWFGSTEGWTHVASTHVPHALPIIPVDHVGRDHLPVEVDGLLLAGDHTTHPSVQGTLRSAERVLEALGVTLPRGPQDLAERTIPEMNA
jgi:glycine/D-amino acid oxidase-like deaminating enzyme